MRERRRQDEESSAAASWDPIALTIAIWLGLVVSAAGLSRVAAEAEQQATLNAVSGRPAASALVPYAR